MQATQIKGVLEIGEVLKRRERKKKKRNCDNGVAEIVGERREIKKDLW